jgi:CDP-diacylglycerol--serine O-phosphatidyltransferase
MVSFGIAPALIIYRLLVPELNNIHLSLTGSGRGLTDFLIYIPVLMPVCAGLRLAKFNTDATQTTSFKGLPTPASAIAVISLVVAAHYTSAPWLKSFADSPSALVIYTVILSLLMVIPLPLLSLKFLNLKFKGNEGRYILIGLVLVFFIIFGLASTPLIIPFYIIVSLASKYLLHPPAGKTM